MQERDLTEAEPRKWHVAQEYIYIYMTPRSGTFRAPLQRKSDLYTPLLKFGKLIPIITKFLGECEGIMKDVIFETRSKTFGTRSQETEPFFFLPSCSIKRKFLFTDLCISKISY